MENLTEPNKPHRFSSEEIKARWADPVWAAETRRKMSDGWAKRRLKQRSQKWLDARKKGGLTTARRNRFIKKIKFLPGAKTLAKWIVR